MAGALCPLSLQTILDNGRPLVGAEIHLFEGGTLTPKTVYVDKALQVAHPHPILTNGQGRVPAIYVKGGDYRIRILKPAPLNEVMEDIDGIAGPLALDENVSSYPLTDPTAVLKTGDVVAAFTAGTRAGFARANGKTVGSALSGATEVAVGVASNLTQPAGTAYNLFVHLWETDPTLPVLASGVAVARGANANADWNANRALTLPDFRGLALVGVDGMGNAAANRLNGGTFSKGDAATLGSLAGTAAETLSVGQIPSHAHGASADVQGAHGHNVSGSTGSAGSHAHNLGNMSGRTGIQTSRSGGSFHDYATSGGSVVTDVVPNTSFVTNTTGNHTHAVTGGTDVQGAHTHTVSIANAGGGLAHNNVQPSGFVTLYIKL